MTALKVIICVLLAALSVETVALAHYVIESKHWKENAKDEAKKRLAKDEKTDEIRLAIDRGAAKLIAAKDKEIADLQERLRYKTCVNERLWSQLRDLKAGDDFDDLS